MVFPLQCPEGVNHSHYQVLAFQIVEQLKGFDAHYRMLGGVIGTDDYIEARDVLVKSICDNFHGVDENKNYFITESETVLNHVSINARINLKTTTKIASFDL